MVCPWAASGDARTARSSMKTPAATSVAAATCVPWSRRRAAILKHDRCPLRRVGRNAGRADSVLTMAGKSNLRLKVLRAIRRSPHGVHFRNRRGDGPVPLLLGYFAGSQRLDAPASDLVGETSCVP